MRQLPAVERVLAAMRARDGGTSPLGATDAVRTVIAAAREAVKSGLAVPGAEELAEAALEELARAARPSLRPVINASGVLLQTNLGRAPLSAQAITAMAEVARGYSNLEYDLEAGERGSRHGHLRELIRRTTGAEDGLAVNNNAAALFLVLQHFARGKEVIVSRGQAVEIGGGVRIPDILAQSGARLVEVGTTNRTYLRDYEAAITPDAAAILWVHSSNFRIIGFTAEVPTAELAALAAARDILLVDDLGSGCLVDSAPYGIDHEPTVQESVRAGVDLSLFSGDKLLGGPQAGIIAGRAALVEQLRRAPLTRALRLDKLAIAALSATLLAYAQGREREEIPIWRMLAAPLEQVRSRAEHWAAAAGAAGSIVAAKTMVGGGSLPGEGVATWCAALALPGADEVAKEFRRGEPAIVPRVHDGRVLLDPRTVDAASDGAVARRIAAIAHSKHTVHPD
ncbi:MAG: L-seryl-tRNA(Sec) selenium transferase [Chloroflexi bacterium]|nr:L-seryl-tRNA(Sec) selenium transferase [Chloroflexota bacterium]